jgi:hypothetical protein
MFLPSTAIIWNNENWKMKISSTICNGEERDWEAQYYSSKLKHGKLVIR